MFVKCSQSVPKFNCCFHGTRLFISISTLKSIYCLHKISAPSPKEGQYLFGLAIPPRPSGHSNSMGGNRLHPKLCRSCGMWITKIYCFSSLI